MARNSEVTVQVDLDELCDKIKAGREESSEKIKSMLIEMDENQFKSCFLKLLRAAVEVESFDAVKIIFIKMEGSLTVGADRGWGWFCCLNYSAKMVIQEILPAATDQELIIRIFKISVRHRQVAVAKFLLDKIFAPLHHAIWGDRDCQRFGCFN